ncbi:MAG: GIY-YIG nuclease family protein, partial [Candidatus Omnitrophica bacterium]|nr:GIY-YIG nuclease family protein [Candidatus Omnitrophota bacterium]
NGSKHYAGFAEDLIRRVEEHNNDESDGYSRRYAPWKVETYVSFRSKENALAFEKYLKAGSGHAFLKKRLI